ncbi:U7 snRNA-associated Sm-like protein LSm10 [Gigantopelta aegis]|uniref:U7 snRNA-associated Sm-like protein LSm10 n=1 Tax=Gigantopelta aegis TaxID=1735272 RepID=UPI001B88D5C8|nr:U7 snRNA-associated Sm-like protein LSm10 [Gigantopelta aegis]
MTSARQHFKINNTLVCLLKTVEGKKTQVELRNENVIVGTIAFCDGFMNLTMKDVTFKPVKGKESKFTDFYVQGKQIRYVHIPDEMDIVKSMDLFVKQKHQPPAVRGRGGRGGGGRGRGRGRSDSYPADDSLKRGGFAFGQGRRGGSSQGQRH